jgi:hypothetical protein
MLMTSDRDANADQDGAEKGEVSPVGRTLSKMTIIAMAMAATVFAFDLSGPLRVVGGVFSPR